MQNKRFILYLFLFLAISGCQKPFGKEPFKQGILALPFVQTSLAKESFEGIAQQYPAALTIFAYRKPPKDRFGKTLLSLLRRQGYGMIDLSITTKKEDLALSSPLLLSWEYSGIGRNSSIVFVRLTIQQSIYTRAFSLQNAMLVPLGPWMQANRVF